MIEYKMGIKRPIVEDEQEELDEIDREVPPFNFVVRLRPIK